MTVDGVKVQGRADRIDLCADGSLAIVDYKTGSVPSKKQVEKGFALQLGLLGLIAGQGQFTDRKTHAVVEGAATAFEYWSFGKKDEGFGKRASPMKLSPKEKGLEPDRFLPFHEEKLHEAIRRFIKGTDPFKARLNPDYKGYNEYDQLMRLEEWLVRLSEKDEDA
jgi:ATP-dependent helicase/nuclease subunit B